MSKKEFKDKILLITYAVILFIVLLNYRWIGSIIGFITNIMAPFLIGSAMAFILNVLVKMYEDKVFAGLPRAKRGLSVLSSLVTVIAFIVFILLILIPQIQNAGSIFIDNIPEYQENIYYIGEKIGLSKNTLEALNLDNIDWKKEVTKLVSENSDHIIQFSIGFANSALGVITNTVIGLVFCIYVLLDKDNLKRQFCKLFKKVFNSKVYNKIIEICSLSNITFANFVKVQVQEATILGVLCLIGMLLLRLPYAATISVLVGFTALIPIFGAFIGCAIGAFLIFMINPIKSLIFILFFLLLQQIEGNFIYPKVVGGKIGLPSIWVLVAVTIGGSLGGIIGMLLSVPLLSVIYTILKEYVNEDKTKKVGGKNVKKTA